MSSPSRCRLALLLACGVVAGSAQAQLIQGTNVGPIPDGTAAGPGKYGAPRDLLFANSSVGTVQSIDLVFQANHSYLGDLKVTLISPQGIEHRLFERTGATSPTAAGASSNLVSSHAGYAFRDSSANNWWTVANLGDVDVPASNARSVVAGPATPPPAVTSINNAFLDRPITGTWILRFEDGWSGDTGDVVSASITITRLVTTQVVTKVADTNDGVCDSDCSLREAIATAVPGQQVSFDPSVFTAPRIIFLGSQLLVDKNLAIVGPGAHRLTVSGGNSSRVFRLTGARITLSGLRIADGAGIDVGCVSAQGGNLVLHRVEISNCRGVGSGGLYQSAGGTLLFSESSISDSQSQERGGGMSLESPARILRSTVSSNLNISPFSLTSGGIWASGELTVVDSTISGNQIRGGGSEQAGGLSRQGGGLLTLSNSVVAGNTGGTADVVEFGGTVSSGGYNVIGRVGVLAGVFNQPGDQFGTQGAPLDPVLSPLSYHGGTLPVHVPLPGSPLLDKGRSFRATDVRGAALVDLPEPPAAGGNNADVGAVELSALAVTNLNFDGPGSLRQALLDAPAAPAVTDIVFDPALTRLPARLRQGTQLSIDRNLSIHGPGSQRLTIDSARQARVLAVQAGRLVSISGLTLADGDGSGSPNSGEGGVALNAEGSHLSVVNSVISGGRSNEGSAIKNRGALWLRGSTVVGNGGSLNSRVISGGSNSVTLIETSTLSGNRGNALDIVSSRATVWRSTIHANDGTSAVVPAVSSVLISGSIVAGQVGGNDLGSGTFLSGGHNLIGNPGAITAFNQAGDQVGSAGVPLNPELSPLGMYSGPVPVHLPLGGSPVIDRGRGRILDQRGLAGFDLISAPPASSGDNSDIGASEAQVLVVSNPGDAGVLTLRQAMLDANANGPGVDDLLFEGFSGVIGVNSPLPTLTGATNLIGRGASSVSIRRNDAAPDFSLLTASGPGAIGISGLTLANGRDDPAGSGRGGAVDITGGALHLNAVEIAGNSAALGAGISVTNADAAIQNSTFAGNASFAGGGIYFQGDDHRLRIEQSTFSGNTASNSGGAILFGANAPDANPSAALIEVYSSTISGNSASVQGGGLFLSSNAVNGPSTATAILKNTLVSGNTGGNLQVNNGAGAGTGSIASQGFNLSDTVQPQLNQGSDLTGANAGLGPLANNGGPVRTRALLGGSAAIDAGLSSGLLFDARGLERRRVLTGIPSVFHDGSDIGAIELQTPPAAPPSASASPTNVGTGGATSYGIAVTYSDAVAINVSSLGTGDLGVTGPNGFNAIPSFVAVDIMTNGTPRVATYSFVPPGGSWDAGDNGSYTLSVQANQVSSTTGAFVPAGIVGTFTVTITAPDPVFANGFEN